MLIQKDKKILRENLCHILRRYGKSNIIPYCEYQRKCYLKTKGYSMAIIADNEKSDHLINRVIANNCKCIGDRCLSYITEQTNILKF